MEHKLVNMSAKQKIQKQSSKEDANLKIQLVRALADYDNLRKRIDKEKDELWRIMLARFVLKVLPVYDMLVNAQEHLADSGIAITIEEFNKILQEEGVEKIAFSEGDIFEAEFCDATDTESAKDKKMQGKIAKVLAEGFKIKDGPVIRPAKVRVYN